MDVMVWLQIAGLLLGGGTLWKMFDNAKKEAEWKGQVNTRFEGLDRDVARHEDDITDLQKFPRVRR